MTETYTPPGPDPLLTHRTESWRVDILSDADTAIATLDGVTGGKIDFSAGATIHGGGQLDVDDIDQVDDWLDLRVRVWWEVDGMEPWALGTFLCTAPTEQHTEFGRSWSVGLLDKLTILDGDSVNGSFSLPAGTVITTAIKAVITGAGESRMSVTDSAETLTAGQVWPAGTSRLRIVNDLCAMINYYGVSCDTLGNYRVRPYVRPQDRTVRRDLTGDAIVDFDWQRDQDLSSVPNRVILIAQASGTDEALVSVAENTDPGSRLSIPTRGRVVAVTESGVEASSQTVLDGLAARKLTDLSSPSATRTIEHAAVPLDLHDVVRHEGVVCSVQSMAHTLAVGALTRTGLREVIV